MAATRQDLEACARLKPNEPAFYEFLQRRLEEYRNVAMSHRDEVSMRWAQGRAQELMDIIDYCDNAHEHLRKVRG